MPIDLKHMLKVYNYVNDEKKPKVNLKFLGVFALLLVAIGAMIFFSVQIQPDTSGPVASRSEYVGLSPTEIAAGLSPSTVEARLDSWRAQHPGVTIESIEPVYDGARLIGYQVTYRE